MAALINSIFLFTVKDHFVITGCGLILTSGAAENLKKIKIGLKIKLVRPDKSELKTAIKGISFEEEHSILISSEYTKDDVPVGTEVWTGS